MQHPNHRSCRVCFFFVKVKCVTAECDNEALWCDRPASKSYSPDARGHAKITSSFLCIFEWKWSVQVWKPLFIGIMMHTKMVGVSYNHRNASENVLPLCLLNKFEVSLQKNVCLSANIVQPCFKITPNSMLPLYLLKKTVLGYFFHLYFSCITRVNVYILFPATFDM